mmetsp:Transcript_81564/g.144031  ORF Transcript_81564/g.144031 Transcript_81564/m.144031 type:complete len:201 (+) Transcript_81564:580-1182(+)
MANDLPRRLKVPTSRCWIDMKLSMSPAVKRLVVMKKRQSISGRNNCRIPSSPFDADHPTPSRPANAQAWKVSAGTLKGNRPPWLRFTQSNRIGPEALSTTKIAHKTAFFAKWLGFTSCCEKFELVLDLLRILQRDPIHPAVALCLCLSCSSPRCFGSIWKAAWWHCEGNGRPELRKHSTCTSHAYLARSTVVPSLKTFSG